MAYIPLLLLITLTGIASSQVAPPHRVPKGPTTSTLKQTVPTSSFPGFCPLNHIACPACDGKTITSSIQLKSFEVLCGKTLISSTRRAVVGISTAGGCVVACQDASGCRGGSFSISSGCSLAFGANTEAVASADSIAFLPRTHSSPPSIISPPADGTNSREIPKSDAFTRQPPVTRASTRQPSDTGGSSANVQQSAAACSMFNLDCPRCEMAHIVDEDNHTYRVLCGSTLSSSSTYAFPGPLPPAICLAHCDARGDNCVGAFVRDNACVLALGRLYGRLSVAGYIAFVPIGAGKNDTLPSTSALPSTQSSLLSSGPLPLTSIRPLTRSPLLPQEPLPSTSVQPLTRSPLLPPEPLPSTSTHPSTQSALLPPEPLPSTSTHPSMQSSLLPPGSLSPSAFPTGPFTIDSIMSALSQTSSPTSSSSSFFSSTSTSQPAFAYPSICTSPVVVDSMNQTYGVTCSEEMLCVETLHLGDITLDQCMTKCDKDGTCIGGSYGLAGTQNCKLCQEGISGRHYAQDRLAFVAFLTPTNSSSRNVSSSFTESQTTLSTISTSIPQSAVSTLSSSTLATAIHLSSTTGIPAVASSSLDAGSTSNSTLLSVFTRSGSPQFNPGNVMSPVSTGDVTSQPILAPPAMVICPASNNNMYDFGAPPHSFQILCDVAADGVDLDAKLADSFEICADYCTVGCDAVEYASPLCVLKASAYVVHSKSGTTVGVSTTVSSAVAFTYSPLGTTPTASETPPAVAVVTTSDIEASIAISAAVSAVMSVRVVKGFQVQASSPTTAGDTDDPDADTTAASDAMDTTTSETVSIQVVTVFPVEALPTGDASDDDDDGDDDGNDSAPTAAVTAPGAVSEVVSVETVTVFPIEATPSTAADIVYDPEDDTAPWSGLTSATAFELSPDAVTVAISAIASDAVVAAAPAPASVDDSDSFRQKHPQQ